MGIAARQAGMGAMLWAVLGAVLLCGSCTPQQYAKWADSSAYKALFGSRETVFGEKDAAEHRKVFGVLYRPLPEDTEGESHAILLGEKRLTVDHGDEQALSLAECLEIAFRNSRSFQTHKEDLYEAALALANARRSWDVPLFGGEATADIDLTKVKKGLKTTTGAADVGPTLTQRFVHGGILTLGMALNLATDFTGGPGTTLGSLIDANFTQPLLRGAWRDFAYEDQYRLERDFLFAVFEYERFTQTFAVSIVTEYYNVLLARNVLENERAGIKRLIPTVNLIRAEVKAGQTRRIELDQAEQNLLNARIRLEDNEQTYRDALDEYKLRLGLPIQTHVRPDYPAALQKLLAAGPDDLGVTERQAIAAALSAEPNLLTERARLRDRIRDVEIAADAFYPQLDVSVGVSAPSQGGPRDFWAVRGDRHTRYAQLRFQYDLDQTDNRDAYRRAAIAEARARRDLAEIEDRLRLDIRQSYRVLQRSLKNYKLQKTSVALAVRRQKLVVREKQQPGLKTSTRDVLDAEDDLRRAQNGLASALVSYTNTRLRFLAQLGMLKVDEKGKIDEPGTYQGFERLQRLYPYIAVPPAATR